MKLSPGGYVPIKMYKDIPKNQLTVTLEISALCESGFSAMILLLLSWDHTMKAFIGLFTWFGGCFFVWNMLKDDVVNGLFLAGYTVMKNQ